MRSYVRLIAACLAGMAVLTLTAATLQEEEMARQSGLMKYVAPEFPFMAEGQGIVAGLTTVAVAWEAEGAPSDVVVLRTNDDAFGVAAREAVMQWRRAPRPGGREVVMYEIRFLKTGVIVSRTNSVSSRRAVEMAENAEPLRLPLSTQLDAPLRAIAQPMPVFPVSARGRWDEARVVVEFYIDETGRVRAPTVQESTAPEFEAETLNALRHWQYEVPRKNGQPTIVTERWAFDFRRSG